MGTIKSYRDLKVWQRSMELVKVVYKLTDQLPKSEEYGLKSQIRRSATSIPSNIAEGKARGHQAEYRQFLLHAFGSGAELETQLKMVDEVEEFNNVDVSEANKYLQEVMKMLNVLIRKLK